jgi:hypothetical protein
MPFGDIPTNPISGLRVFINPAGAVAPGERSVFYSRRSCGPYYRWCFEKEPGRWRSSRMQPSFAGLKALRITGWAAVPLVLRVRLGEHYLD